MTRSTNPLIIIIIFLLSQQMLDAIKHITDVFFFFQQPSAQVHCACNTVRLSEKCDFRVFFRFAR